MNKILKSILDFIFPTECLDCGAEDELLCKDCFNKIELRNLKQCPLCNKQQPKDKLCPACKETSYLDEIIICADYENEILQKTIRYFKYKYVKDLGAALGQIMINKYKQIKQLPNALIIPTPLHQRRTLERGFNQAELLAEQFADYFDLPILNQVLYRQKNIEHQANLNKKQRLKNIKGCFTIKNIELIKNQNIILVDDVITTGATLNEQAKLLKQNNARKVWAVVIAKN